MDAPIAPDFAERLLDWYDTSGRALPWRTHPSLYRTIVSEFMAQQTRIDTMLPYFERWMARFPDIATLARADEAEVLKSWEGLGYYNRARNLHRLAQVLETTETPPETIAGWQELPGIGPYTAAAIASIHQGVPEPVIDGNVVRVLARQTGEETEFRDTADARRVLLPEARRRISRQRPGDYNQAIMELGATVCLKHKPLCTACPVIRGCVAGPRGDADRLPRLRARRFTEQTVRRAWVEDDRGRLLLHRRSGEARRLAGIWELPEIAALGISPGLEAPWAKRRRGIANERITEEIYRIPPARIDDLPSRNLAWFAVDELAQATLSGPHRRWIAELRR